MTMPFQSTPFARRETSGSPFGFPFSTSFQSTPFARRETGRKRGKNGKYTRFNPLPSQEGRPWEALHEESINMFQSTPFARRETETKIRKAKQMRYVSIHSLRKKGDPV